MACASTTSSTCSRTFTPECRAFSATWARPSVCMSARARWQPRPARIEASAPPMPPAAPVITATPLRKGSFTSQVEGQPAIDFQLLQPAGLVGKIEGLAGVIPAHVEPHAPDGGYPHLQAAAIIDPVFGRLGAIGNRRARRHKAAELHAARPERTNVRAFGSGIYEEIVEALVDRHADVLRRRGRSPRQGRCGDWGNVY